MILEFLSVLVNVNSALYWCRAKGPRSNLLIQTDFNLQQWFSPLCILSTAHFLSLPNTDQIISSLAEINIQMCSAASRQDWKPLHDCLCIEILISDPAGQYKLWKTHCMQSRVLKRFLSYAFREKQNEAHELATQRHLQCIRHEGQVLPFKVIYTIITQNLWLNTV